MRKQNIRGLAVFMAAAMVVSALSGGVSAAASGAKLKTKSLVMKKGEKKTIRITGKKKKAKYSFQVKKKSIASVTAKGVVKGLKKGETTIAVFEKKNKKSKKKKIGTVSVKVRAAGAPVKTEKPSGSVTPGPPVKTDTPAPTGTPIVDATAEPTKPAASKTPKPTETPFKTVEPGQTLKPATEPSIKKTWLDDDITPPSDFDKKVDGVTYGEIQKISYYSFIAQKKRNARVILPPNYDSSKEYPVAYLLHGIGGDEGEWMGGAPDKIIGNMIARGTAKEMILVLPNQLVQIPGEAMPSYYLDPGRFVMFDRIVEELKTSLMPFIETNYSVKPGRDNRAVCGLSMGGREAIHVGIDLIEDFAYMGAFTPAIGVLPYETEAGLFTTETLTIPEEYRPISMFMIVEGENDTTVWDNPKKYSETLKANGVDHFYYSWPGGHSFGPWKNGLYNFARRIFQS